MIIHCVSKTLLWSLFTKWWFIPLEMQPTWKILDIFLCMNEWIKPMHCSMKVDIMRCVHNICTTCMYTWWCNQLGWNPIWRSILIFTHMLFQYVKKVCTCVCIMYIIKEAVRTFLVDVGFCHVLYFGQKTIIKIKK